MRNISYIDMDSLVWATVFKDNYFSEIKKMRFYDLRNEIRISSSSSSSQFFQCRGVRVG